MKFKGKQNPTRIVEARQIDVRTQYRSAGKNGQDVWAEVGDWEITQRNRNGAIFIGVVKSNDFENLYEPLDIDEEVAIIAEQEVDAAIADEKAQVDEFIEKWKSPTLEEG